MKPHNQRPRAAAAAILASWAVFLALLGYLWPYVGITPTDAFLGAAAYGVAFQVPSMLSVAPCVRFLGLSVPLMHNPFIGPWSIYGLIPFVALGGCTLFSLRAYSACLFLLALWGTYRLAWAVHRDAAAAGLCALLLALSPVMAGEGSQQLSLMLPLAASVWAVYFCLSFARRREAADAVLACAALSAGLCSGPWVAALLVGLILFAALTARRCLRLLPGFPRERLALAAGCALGAGFFLLPVLAFNLSTAGFTLRFLAEHLSQRDPLFCHPGNGSCSNLDYWINLKERLRELAILSDGFTALASKPLHWLYIGPLLLSLLGAARQAWRRRSLWSASAALWIVTAGYLLISAVSPTESITLHMTPLAPILAVLTLSGLGAGRKGRIRTAALAAAAGLAAAQLAGDVWLLRGDNIDPARNGWYQESPAIVDACRWAGERPDTPIVNLTLAFAAAAPYFTYGRARVVSLSPAQLLSPDAAIDWEPFLRRQDKPVFLVENDALSARALAGLKAQAAKDGRALSAVKTFADSRGRTAFEIYAVR